MSISLLQKTMSENPLWKEQVQARIALKTINLKHWLELNLFSPVWWLMLIIFIATWFIWWKLVNKTKLLEIVTYGLLVAFLFTILDFIGAEYVLWGYPNMILPLMPSLFVADLGSFPVIYMLIYQYFPDWIKFTIAITIASSFLAFIAEPIAVSLDIYQMNNWQHLYSFPIYIALALILKWILKKIIEKE